MDERPTNDASIYTRGYVQSPGPNAPIPPTPHSQHVAQSPPLLTRDYRSNHDVPSFSPVAPVGSSFPFPYTRVRRQTHILHSANNSNANANANANGAGGAGGGRHRCSGASMLHIDNTLFREQYANQWQIYAQNNN